MKKLRNTFLYLISLLLVQNLKSVVIINKTCNSVILKIQPKFPDEISSAKRPEFNNVFDVELKGFHEKHKTQNKLFFAGKIEVLSASYKGSQIADGRLTSGDHPLVMKAISEIPFLEIIIEESRNPYIPRFIIPKDEELKKLILKEHQKNAGIIIKETVPELPGAVVGIAAEYCTPEL